jgi:hypothetical protein
MEAIFFIHNDGTDPFEPQSPIFFPPVPLFLSIEFSSIEFEFFGSGLWDHGIFFCRDLQNNSLSINQSFVNRISHTNTKLWMYGNAQVCGGSSASKNPICVPQEYSSLIEDDITNVTAADSSNCSCTPPDVPGPFLGSNSACNCVQPIVVGFQLKSPSFLFFDEFSEVFLSWLTAGLDLSLSQVSIQDAQWVGPRLQMTLLLLPEVGVFNVTEFDSLYAIFSQWKIVDNPVLGPYELLSFYPRTPPG